MSTAQTDEVWWPGCWDQRRSGRRIAVTVEAFETLTLGRRRALTVEVERVGAVQEWAR
ncbi:MAG: hypothetical protein QOE51_4151 [Actinoplanes sp.]|nr:hypothetical protein [Actinoplanes sp.]